MAKFGIEAIRYFKNVRAAGVSTAGDLTYTFNRANGFKNKLRSAGHTQTFYWSNTNCFERDFRDTTLGGDDSQWADKVDIVWLETHGNNTSKGPRVLFDVKRDEWRANGSDWRLGNVDLEWMMLFSCSTVNRSNVGALWPIFRGLHIYCGAYSFMYDGYTTDECGEDVADNLTDGETVSESWIDGVSDWWVDNHPITVCPASAWVYNNGNVRWNSSFLNKDHFWGHGTVLPDPAMNDQVALLYRWSEG
jgi:hypothetical protein